MGNTPSDENETVYFKYVGRQKDMKKAKKLVCKNRSVRISGLKKIGKTRFLHEFQKALTVSDDFKGWRLVWQDFELDNIESGSTQYEWFERLYNCIGAKAEKERFNNRYPEKDISCRSCDQCKRGDTSCEKQGKLFKEEINTLIKHLKECEEKIILFLDNVDKIMKSSLKDHFLTFHRESLLNCSTLKTVIASAYKPKQVLKQFASLELQTLEDDDILKMLFLATEYKNVDSDDEDVNSNEEDNNSDKENVKNDKEDDNVRYSPELRVFKEENRPYICAIVRLCEGLPLAAAMSGLLLTEDDGLLTPADLVEILICIRLKSLSPDNCPPEDRLDIYKRSMEEVEDVGSFFNNLNETMTGCFFTIDEAVAAAEGNNTSARVKMNIIKPCLDRSILSLKSLSGPEQVKWHGILRESQASLKVLNGIPQGDDSAKEMVLKFMRENVQKAKLDFDDEILSNPKLLEQAILSLSPQTKMPTRAESEESDEASDGDIKMSELKEHRNQTEQFSTMSSSDSTPLREKDTKAVPLVTAPIATETHQENHLDRDKVRIRYSENKTSRSNGLHLKFTNDRQDGGLPVSNEFNVVSPPPPYTTLPEEQETRERNGRLSYGSRYPFQHNPPTIPPVGEPPPRYSSTDQFPPVHDQRSYNADRTMSHAYSFESGTRSRSTPTVFLPPTLSKSFPSFGEYTSVTSNTLADKCGQNLRRAHSDPVCSRAGERMRELDTSYTDSLTGPPALNYSPPNEPSQNADGLHRGSISFSSREQNNTGLSNRATSQEMHDLKEGVHDTSFEASKTVQLIAKGVNGISLREKTELATFDPGAMSYIHT